MNNGGFLGFGRGAPNLATPIARYIQSPVYYSSTTIIPPPGTKQIHAWLVGGGGGGGSSHKHHYGHNDGQSPHYMVGHSGAGAGFGGAACFDIPVTTDPIVLTIGAGGAATLSGGQSKITIGGMVVAQVGGGGGTACDPHNPATESGKARFGGGGSGGGHSFSGPAQFNGHYGYWEYGGISYSNAEGNGGGEPPGSGKGGSRVISWIYSDAPFVWRDAYVNQSAVQQFYQPSPSLLRQGMMPLNTVVNHIGGPSQAHSHQQYTVLPPFPWGTAIRGPMHQDPHNQPPTGRGSGFFGAGGVGGTRMNFHSAPGHHTTTPGTGGFGGGGATSGANGLEGGGAAGRGATVSYGGFQGGGGTGGSFPNTPHLWGLRTGQATSGGGAGLFTPSTTVDGGAGGGGGGANTTITQQQGPAHTGARHDTYTGPGSTGGSGCAVFRFYV